MNKKDSLSHQIETLVRERNIIAAKKMIKTWLRINGKTIPNKITAANWLRRMGLSRNAFILIEPRNWNFIKAKENDEIAKQYIWTAYILNLLGATRYAIKIIDKVTVRTADEFRIKGDVYLANYNYLKAKESYDEYFKRLNEKEKLTYIARISKINYADSLAGVSQFKEAINVIESIEYEKDELNLQSIIFQAKAEYLISLDKVDQALSSLNKAETILIVNNPTADQAFLYKWKAYVLAKKNNFEESEKLFTKAFQILVNPNYRPESWLECLYLQLELKVLNERLKLVLYSYPDLPFDFRNRKHMPACISIWNAKATITLLPFRNEIIRKGVYEWGIGIPLKLLSLLIAAGEFGVPVERLKTMLWPDELSSFMQLNNRLDQILHTLKKEWKISCKTEDNVVRISEGDISRFNVEIMHWKTQSTFYEKYPIFTSKNLMDYYGLKKSTLHDLIKSELNTGNIEILDDSKKTKSYSVTSRNTART